MTESGRPPYQVVLLAGDGIGPEVTDATVQVMKHVIQGLPEFRVQFTSREAGVVRPTASGSVTDFCPWMFTTAGAEFFTAVTIGVTRSAGEASVGCGWDAPMLAARARGHSAGRAARQESRRRMGIACRPKWKAGRSLSGVASGGRGAGDRQGRVTHR